MPHGDDEEQDNDEDDDELDDGDDGGPGPSGGKVSKKPLDDSEDIFDKDKDPEEMTLQELIDAQPDHWKSGKAGDGKVYLNDDGEKVKLNVKGTHTRLEMMVEDCSRRHYVPKKPTLLKNGANSLNLTGTPSSNPRRRSWRRRRPMTKLKG